MSLPVTSAQPTVSHDVDPSKYEQWKRRMRKRLGRTTETAERHVLVASWQEKLASRFEHWAGQLREHTPPLGTEGYRLRFAISGASLGYPIYDVVSVRGGVKMGTIEWSNQWRRPRFKADPDAVFDQQCVAEIFAQMKVYK